MKNPDLKASKITAFSEEDDRILKAHSEHINQHGPYDPYDSSFFVGHSTEDRLIEFDTLTATIDDIMKQCDIPEEYREELTELHRECTKDFLRYYKGPIEGPIPLLGRASSPRPS